MDGNKESRESDLFLVRLWLDDETGEKKDWHGKVQHVITGKAASFSNQASMIRLFSTMSSSSEQANTEPVNPPDKVATDAEAQGT